jgi:hypothetical protein
MLGSPLSRRFSAVQYPFSDVPGIPAILIAKTGRRFVIIAAISALPHLAQLAFPCTLGTRVSGRFSAASGPFQAVLRIWP